MRYVIITTATNDKEEATKIAHGLVQNKLAAAVHIGQVESFYTWQNKLENAQEYTISAKTKKANFSKVENYIKANHHYILPEIAMIPIKYGSKEFINWISNNVV